MSVAVTGERQADDVVLLLLHGGSARNFTPIKIDRRANNDLFFLRLSSGKMQQQHPLFPMARLRRRHNDDGGNRPGRSFFHLCLFNTKLLVLPVFFLLLLVQEERNIYKDF